MRKIILFLLISGYFTLLISCNTASPEKYFNVVVLNCNLMHDFTTDGMLRQLASSTVKMVDNNPNHTVPMKRKEIVDSKIESLEPNFKKLNSLKETEDAKDMLNASKALYDYTLPVYKNEYRQLAKLYDEGASETDIEAYAQSIQEKYYPKFASSMML